MKRIICALLVLLFLPAAALAGEAGFVSDVDRINEAANSVLMLEIRDRGRLVATGSAFAILDGRTIVTNYHVIEDGDAVAAYTDTGEVFQADRLLVADPDKDLAILSIDRDTGLAPLELSGREIRRAAPVVAIGSPKGIRNTVSMGNISGFFEDEGIRYVQFTAPISSGSSGGVLLDDYGCVVGITSAAYDDGRGIIQNINFAVSAGDIRELCEAIPEHWPVTMAEFGQGRLPGRIGTEPTQGPTREPNTLRRSPGPASTRPPSGSAPETPRGRGDIWMYITFGSDWTVFLEDEEELDVAQYRVNSNTVAVFEDASDTTLEFAPLPGDKVLLSVDGEAFVLARVGDAYTQDAASSRGKPGALAGVWDWDGDLIAIEVALENGSQGESVRAMQEALARNGCLDGAVDGVFDRRTDAAVRAFRARNDLPSGGYDSVATGRMLDLLYADGSASPREDDFALVITDGGAGEWEFQSDGSLRMRVEVTNTSGSRAVSEFDLVYYATDARDERLFRAGKSRTATTAAAVAPGETAFSDYCVVPASGSIGRVYAGLSRVVFEDGAVMEADEIEYFYWEIER